MQRDSNGNLQLTPYEAETLNRMRPDDRKLLGEFARDMLAELDKIKRERR